MDTTAPPVDPSWPESLQALIRLAQIRRYRKGAVLIHEADVGDTLFIVLSGRVKAFSADDRDREVIYGIYGPGEYLGEMSLDGGPRSASVITMEASCCAIVTRITLQAHIANHPEFAFELLSRVIRRARLATQSMRSMALLDVYGRLTQLLRELAQPLPDGRSQVSPRITHAEMAHRVGCSREMVSRLMKDLERGRYLSVEGKAWVIEHTLPQRW